MTGLGAGRLHGLIGFGRPPNSVFQHLTVVRRRIGLWAVPRLQITDAAVAVLLMPTDQPAPLWMRPIIIAEHVARHRMVS